MARRKRKKDSETPEGVKAESAAGRPVLRLGGGVYRVDFGPGLGDPAIITGRMDGHGRIIIERADDDGLERMWGRS